MPRGHVKADGRRVALLRGEAGLTQADLAGLAGFGLRTIGKMETGQPTTALTLSAVATVLSRRLKRIITLGDLLEPSSESHQFLTGFDNDFLVAEHVKVLDLRRWRSRGDHPVELIDHHRFRRIPDGLTEVAFHYGTTGTGLAGKCLSHPDLYEWSAVKPNGHCPRLNRACVLRVRLSGPCGPADWDIKNNIEFSDGFGGEEREWFHAPVTHPTESLTLLLLFPEQKPFQAMRGLCQYHPAEAFLTLPQQPIDLQGQRLAYWRISAPQVGETYRIEWDW